MLAHELEPDQRTRRVTGVTQEYRTSLAPARLGIICRRRFGCRSPWRVVVASHCSRRGSICVKIAVEHILHQTLADMPLAFNAFTALTAFFLG